MATVNKDFKIKSGLIVEGTNGTINGQDILTKKQADQDFIVGLIGGSATSNATANSVVLRDSNSSFSANVITADIQGDVFGNADTATKLATSRTISLSGDATGSISFDGSTNKDIQVTLDSSFATKSYADDAAGNAQSAAESYADSAAGNAYANATSYADSAAGNAYSNAVSDAYNYANGVAGQAYSNAQSYADSVAGDAYANATSYTDNAITNLNLTGTYDALGSAANAYSNAVAYTDQEIAALVDSAPDLLNTLNELAAAIADNPNYATDIANMIAGKQDTLTAGEGVYIDANNIITGRQQSGGGLKFVFNEAAIDRSTVDGWYDANGAAYTAEQNARGYADDLASNYDAVGSAANAYSNATSYADSLASNYDAAGAAANAYANATAYTDTAIGNIPDALITSVSNDFNVSGGELQIATEFVTPTGNQTLTNKELVNPYINGQIRLEDSSNTYAAFITLQSDELVLDTDARNIVLFPEAGGAVYVNDSNTSDNIVVTQGTLNNAINGANITPASVQINNYRKEEATQQYVNNAGTVNVHSLSGMYESVKYLVRVVGWVGGVKHSQISEILMTVDGNNNIAITEYGTVCTDVNNLATFSAALDGNSNPTLTATTAVNGCEIIAAATMLSWAD